MEGIRGQHEVDGLHLAFHPVKIISSAQLHEISAVHYVGRLHRDEIGRIGLQISRDRKLALNSNRKSVISDLKLEIVDFNISA